MKKQTGDKYIGTEGLVDLIEEIRLRTWARLNYAAPEQRAKDLHPIIVQEMEQRDVELAV